MLDFNLISDKDRRNDNHVCLLAGGPSIRVGTSLAASCWCPGSMHLDSCHNFDESQLAGASALLLGPSTRSHSLPEEHPHGCAPSLGVSMPCTAQNPVPPAVRSPRRVPLGPFLLLTFLPACSHVL